MILFNYVLDMCLCLCMYICTCTQTCLQHLVSACNTPLKHMLFPHPTLRCATAVHFQASCNSNSTYVRMCKCVYLYVFVACLTAIIYVLCVISMQSLLRFAGPTTVSSMPLYDFYSAATYSSMHLYVYMYINVRMSV